VEILSQSKSQPRVIDIGGNIGWFSLLSAALGAKIDTFEPNKMNYLRTCESLCINDWVGEPCPQVGHLVVAGSNRSGRVRLFPVGVGSREELVTFDTGGDSNNPGKGKISRDKKPQGLREKIRLVALDALADKLGWFQEDIAILKIDVEGFELDVVRGAKALLQSKRVQNIFMEGNVLSKSDVINFKEIAQTLLDSGYVVYKTGGFMGPKNIYVPTPNMTQVNGVAFQCRGGAGRRRYQCNLWWRQAT
jgi:FkbM family methyltransferase